MEIKSYFAPNCGIFSVRFGLHKTGNPSYLSWPRAHVRPPVALRVSCTSGMRKGFLGGTRVTSIIFIKKPGFTTFWFFIYRVLFPNKSIFQKFAILIFRIIAMYVKQRQTMRHKQKYDIYKKQVI